MKVNDIVSESIENKVAFQSSLLDEGRKPKHKKKSHKKHDDDELDNESPEDPEEDKNPHILMQLRKALDVDGDHPISFKNGKKIKLSMNQITSFIQKYMSAKPDVKKEMQDKASESLEGFESALKTKVEKSKSK